MELKDILYRDLPKALSAEFGVEVAAEALQIGPTRKEYDGDFTLIVFPFVQVTKAKPEEVGSRLGEWLLANTDWLKRYNVVKGFLNLELNDQNVWASLEKVVASDSYWTYPKHGRKALVEFSSPNTNKPLHLGHVRNILLGWSVSKILEANGFDVFKTQIINDRGIAICKSMVAWQLFGAGKNPESSGVKGDHFVGDFYVLFEEKFKEEYALWQKSDLARTYFGEKKAEGQTEEDFFKKYKNQYFNDYSELGKAAKRLLIKWESGDEDTVELWKRMNGWVYEGFEETYQKLHVHFDKNYYESETYLLGKSIVEQGVEKGNFYREEDGSVWVDLEDAGLDKKILLRSDGTSVYITQDLGTAELRAKEVGAERVIYVVADEQNYHFQVLFETLKRYGAPYADGLYHLSYGMVELPDGKMKSREGTVVDADDLIAEVIGEATAVAEERGDLGVISHEERKDILRRIGLGALKYFMIKVQPRKRMIFDPKESVDMQGNTGPYIQNAYVRIKSVLRKSEIEHAVINADIELHPAERELIFLVNQYREMLKTALDEYDPAAVAHYCYTLARAFHKFYHDCSILNAPEADVLSNRIAIATVTADALQKGMDLLGIEMPERM